MTRNLAMEIIFFQMSMPQWQHDFLPPPGQQHSTFRRHLAALELICNSGRLIVLQLQLSSEVFIVLVCRTRRRCRLIFQIFCGTATATLAVAG